MKITIEVPDDVAAAVERNRIIAGWTEEDTLQAIEEMCIDSIRSLFADPSEFAQLVEGDSEDDARRIACELSNLADHALVCLTAVSYGGRKEYAYAGINMSVSEINALRRAMEIPGEEEEF